MPLRSLVGLALGTSLLASLPTWFVGFASDDLSHRLLLEGAVPGYSGGWFGLYDITSPTAPAPELVRQGLLPWFTSPELSLRFFRPLASLTLAIDHVLFGRDAFLAHLHSTLWMMALTTLASLCYRRWLTARAACLATIVFALSSAHGMPLSWLASRHTLVAATFGALALWAWLRCREDAWRAGLPLALVALVLGLLSSESGLVAVALLTTYEVARGGLRRGLLRAAPLLGVALCYLTAYAWLGYGARGSSFYVSPFSAPLAYGRAALLGVPALLAELLVGVPSVAAGVGGPEVLFALSTIGTLATLGAWFAARVLRDQIPDRARAALRWLSIGTLIGLGALVGAPVSGRVLPLPAVVGSALAAQLLTSAWPLLWRRTGACIAGAEPGHVWRWRGLALTVALFQLGVSPLSHFAMAAQFVDVVTQQRDLALQADVGRCSSSGSLYLVNGSDPTLTLYAGAALAFYAPEKARAEHLRVLSMAPGPQRLTRTAEGTLELEVAGGARRSSAFEQLFLSTSQPIEAGWQVTLPELRVTVDGASAGLYTRARFERGDGFEPSNTCLVVWHEGRLRQVPLPGVGQALEVEHEPGPMGL